MLPIWVYRFTVFTKSRQRLDIRPKRSLNSNRAKSSYPMTYCSVIESVWRVARYYHGCVTAVQNITDHDSTDYVLCAKFQNDSTTDADVVDGRECQIFEFKMSFERISYFATALGR